MIISSGNLWIEINNLSYKYGRYLVNSQIYTILTSYDRIIELIDQNFSDNFRGIIHEYIDLLLKINEIVHINFFVKRKVHDTMQYQI